MKWVYLPLYDYVFVLDVAQAVSVHLSAKDLL